MNTKGLKHLDLQIRNFIEQGLNNNSTKTANANVIGMDKSSVCKEIKKHSFEVKFTRQGVSSVGTDDCQNIASCEFNSFCRSECLQRVPMVCKTRDKMKGICPMGVIKKVFVSSQSDTTLQNEPSKNINIL